MKKKTADKLIKMILESFDFERVHDAMVEDNWTWLHAAGGGVPTIEELQEQAIYSLQEVCFTRGKYFKMSNGGFEAERYKGAITLRFIWESIVADKDWLEGKDFYHNANGSQ